MVDVAISAAVGIGTRFLSLLFQPTRESEGARLDDLDVPKSQVGIAIAKPYGRRLFKGLNIFWATPLKEVKEEDEVGGKGGGGETRTTYTYFATFAALICEGEISRIEKIWLNGSLVYHNGDSISLDTENANELLVTDHLTIYTGTEGQDPDPVIVGVEGNGNVPSFKRLAYLVFRDLPLDNFSNRIPKIDVLVRERESPLLLHNVVRDVITSKTLIEDDELLTSEIEGITFGGITLKQDGQSVWDFIQSLQKIFNFYLRESDGKISCIQIKRPGISAVISKDEFGTHETGSLPENAYTEEMDEAITIPTIVQIEYQVENNDLKPGIQSAIKGSIGRDSVENIKVDITAQDVLIQKACQRILRLNWLHRYKVLDIFLPPNRLNLNVGDVIALELESGTKAIQINKIDIGLNLIVKVSGVGYEADLSDIDFPTFEDSPYTPRVDVPFYGDPDSIPLDLPLLSDSDSELGLYHATDTEYSFRNGVVYGKYEGGTYRRVLEVDEASPVGELLSPIRYHNPFVRDVTTSFDIRLKRSLLDSIPLLTHFDLAQLMLVGNELIAVQNAVLIAPNEYRCSGLIRGCRGTDYTQAIHNAGDRVIVLRSNYYRYKRMPGRTTDLDRQITFKVVPSGRSLSSVATDTDIIVDGKSLKPYAPSPPKLQKYYPSGDLRISWHFRSRTDGEWRDRVETPLDQPSQSYSLVILYSNAIVHLAESSTNSYIWTAAQQLEDTNTYPTELDIYLVQNSPVCGAGFPGVYQNIKISEILI